jgi:hypothetical protein
MVIKQLESNKFQPLYHKIYNLAVLLKRITDLNLKVKNIKLLEENTVENLMMLG